MTTIDVGEGLLRQSLLFAQIDHFLDLPLPDAGHFPRRGDRPSPSEVLISPLLALGRELLRPPPDDPAPDRWREIAAYVLRLAYVAARRPPAGSSESGDDEGGMAHNRLGWDIHDLRDLAPADREKLKAAIRAVAEPLLPGTRDGLGTLSMDHSPADPERQEQVARSVKGKRGEQRMLKKLAGGRLPARCKR